MKIGHEMQSTNTKTNVTRADHSNSQVFHQLLKSESKGMKQQEIQGMLKQISDQGERLAHYRSFQDLVKFKRLIKDFLKKTVSDGYQLERAHSFGFNGGRQLELVKEVDEKLVELTEEVMDQEKKSVAILDLIGELKGLLINIYQ